MRDTVGALQRHRACEALREQFGQSGIIAAAALGGLADAHAAAVSVAALVAAGNAAPNDAVLPILAGLSTNTVSKMIFAVASRSPRYALAVVPGLVLKRPNTRRFTPSTSAFAPFALSANQQAAAQSRGQIQNDWVNAAQVVN